MTVYVTWGSGKVKLTWKPKSEIEQTNSVTSAHGFCFYKEQLLLVNLNHRGWDITGGHIESNESPKDCFNREAMEEGYVEGESHFLGYVEVNHHENPNWNEASPYPKVGYQAFYRMNINHLHPFSSEFESSQRIFIDPKNAPEYHHEWNEVLQESLEYAMTIK